VDSPGGEPKQIRGARLWVLKKLPDGSWKCFRGMETTVAVVVGALTPLAGQVVQAPAASAGSDRGRDADRAAIEKLKHQDAAATIARDAAAMADLWTDDAVRFGPDTPADVGKQAIRETNERSTARPIKVLTFVPETKDLTIWDGGAVEWRYFSASVASPGGEPTQVRGTVLAVHKQLPDGSWSLPRKRDLRGCISLLDGVQARPQRALPHQALNRVDHEHGPDRKLDQIPVENPVSITGGSRSNPDG
jgi:uncharacterized protein (TIGR02246 family)